MLMFVVNINERSALEKETKSYNIYLQFLVKPVTFLINSVENNVNFI